MTVRTRFAPSPTGYLHVGGARTALFCYLFARRHQGQFLLRIEDTDRQRSTQASIDAILEGMDWLGLQYDGDAVYQTRRFDRYREVVEKLLQNGDAYRCYCSKEELDALREAQMAAGTKPRYDGRYRDFQGPAPEGIDPVIRFRNPQSGHVAWNDLVKGPIEIANEELDDLVIARADGTPTYNLTVVVDDLDMQISHVVRGDDHVNNTPRQINIYRALGAEPPQFAHLPMILGDDGGRLSKRHGAVSVLAYRDAGFLPEALLNYLVRLGWSHGDQELFSLEEMIQWFELSEVNRSAASFNTDKLRWVNQQYIQRLPADQLAKTLERLLNQQGVDTGGGPALTAVVELLRERASTLLEMCEQARFLFEEFDQYDEKAARKLNSAAREPLLVLRQRLAAAGDWCPDSLQTLIENVVAELAIGFGKVGQPLRVALTGRAAAPANNELLSVMGRNLALARIDRAVGHIDQVAE